MYGLSLILFFSNFGSGAFVVMGELMKQYSQQPNYHKSRQKISGDTMVDKKNVKGKICDSKFVKSGPNVITI